jgi:hypothetical protein
MCGCHRLRNASELRDVVDPLAQRRDADREGVDAGEEVLARAAVAGLLPWPLLLLSLLVPPSSSRPRQSAPSYAASRCCSAAPIWWGRSLTEQARARSAPPAPHAISGSQGIREPGDDAMRAGRSAFQRLPTAAACCPAARKRAPPAPESSAAMKRSIHDTRGIIRACPSAAGLRRRANGGREWSMRASGGDTSPLLDGPAQQRQARGPARSGRPTARQAPGGAPRGAGACGADGASAPHASSRGQRGPGTDEVSEGAAPAGE